MLTSVSRSLARTCGGGDRAGVSRSPPGTYTDSLQHVACQVKPYSKEKKMQKDAF
jgi:hypothetical protein